MLIPQVLHLVFFLYTSVRCIMCICGVAFLRYPICFAKCIIFDIVSPGQGRLFDTVYMSVRKRHIVTTTCC